MPAKKKNVKNVDKKSLEMEVHELAIRVENAEKKAEEAHNKAEECYKKMNRALGQLNSIIDLLPKIKKCCDRLGIWRHPLRKAKEGDCKIM